MIFSPLMDRHFKPTWNNGFRTTLCMVCFVLLNSCGIFMPDGFDEDCDTSYRSTVVTANIEGEPGAFEGTVYLQDVVGSDSRSSSGHCHGGTTNKSRPSSETFELNLCVPNSDSENEFTLEIRQETVGQPFDMPDGAIFAVQEIFGESHSNEWSGFQVKYNERSGKYYSSKVDEDQLLSCSSKFLS
jgi:hypothetical protein